MRDLRVFTGNAHPALAQSIANHLGMPLGIALVADAILHIHEDRSVSALFR